LKIIKHETCLHFQLTRKPSKRQISYKDDVLEKCEIVDVSEPNHTNEAKSNADRSTDCPLIDRFPPESAEELAVNPHKVDEQKELQVRRWIQKKRDRCRRNKLLLLTGPSGSGKTATVRVLCHELKVDLIEWNASESFEIFYDMEGDEVVCEESQVSSLLCLVFEILYSKKGDYGIFSYGCYKKIIGQRTGRPCDDAFFA
uniref:ATPase_AAA_core domain-containing protein n=1 Tax=Gongylonema pulchrum TaxID=637853 RepID=A0A183D5V7_9BILA